MAEQPYLFGPIWIPIKDGDATAMSIFRRHYSYDKAKKRRLHQFIGPGEKMVLITPDAKALFAWRKFINDDGNTGVNCCIFRNEGTYLGRSSDLIREAMRIAWERWPNERLYTYVDESKIRRKRDPGRCFMRAGFKPCGKSKSGKLIFESLNDGCANAL
jgi:hypothetical protein